MAVASLESAVGGLDATVVTHTIAHIVLRGPRAADMIDVANDVLSLCPGLELASFAVSTLVGDLANASVALA